jgi:hypothetical protein
MRSDGWRARAWLALPALLALGACSKPKSYIVLSLRSASSSPIMDVVEVDVKAAQPLMPPFSFEQSLTYVTKDRKPYTIPAANDIQPVENDLSLSFAGARAGNVLLDVTVKSGSGCVLGQLDSAPALIRQGGIGSDIVFLKPSLTGCGIPDAGTDAVPPPESDAGFTGCDPVTPLSTCAPGETCQVNCTLRQGQCTMGGTGGPGSLCKTNADCAPGSQCFDYSMTGAGCPVKVCLRYCNDDQGCSSGGFDAGAGAAPQADAGDGAGDAGADARDGAPESVAPAGAAPAGPRSLCQGPVCDSPYHTCTFACDPRATAVAGGTSGCPTGLSCVVIPGMDQVDCTCPEITRTGHDGDDCRAGGVHCAPGFICDFLTTDNAKCRAVCRCDAKDLTCTAPNDCTGGKLCTALEGETTFGACL